MAAWCVYQYGRKKWHHLVFFQHNSPAPPLSLSLSLSFSFSSHLIYYWSGDLDHISIPNIRYSLTPNWLFLPINLTHFPSWSTITAKNGRLPCCPAVARKGSSSRRWILNQLPAILHRREYITSFEQHWSMSNNVTKHDYHVAALARQKVPAAVANLSGDSF